MSEPLIAGLRGEVPAAVALMRAVLSGLPASEVARAAVALPDAADTAEERVRAAAIAALARDHAAGLTQLERLVAAGAAHGDAVSGEAAVAGAAAMFDALVAVSPEASVAAYSLGDAGLLAAATAEVVDWLRGLGLLAGRPVVLDLGCGIGRLAAALAPEAGAVLALDVSVGMVAAARERLAGLPGVRVEQGSGHDLSGVPDAVFDLVLAADVFPYLVQGGPALVARHVAEVGRVLRPGGSLAVLNWSYRGLEHDRPDVVPLATAHGFAVELDGTRPFTTWDAAAWWLRRT